MVIAGTKVKGDLHRSGSSNTPPHT